MRYLLDTNVVCEATGKTPDQNVMRWLGANTDECTISALILGEIWKGIHLMAKGKRKTAISNWVESIESDFQEVTLPLDTQTMKIWAKLYAKHESKGRNLGMIDSLIAATALAHDLTVVTRNTRDFPAEVSTINPWIV
jgi:predicted nucleic acid-binding protein